MVLYRNRLTTKSTIMDLKDQNAEALNSGLSDTTTL